VSNGWPFPAKPEVAKAASLLRRRGFVPIGKRWEDQGEFRKVLRVYRRYVWDNGTQWTEWADLDRDGTITFRLGDIPLRSRNRHAVRQPRPMVSKANKS
jgi:hypothetical protein